MPRRHGREERSPHRRRRGTTRFFPHATVRHDPLPLLLDPGGHGARHHCGFGAVRSQREMGAARETIGPLGHGAKYGQAHGADESSVNDATVTEAGGAEVDGVMCRRDEGSTGRCVGRGVGEEEVRQEAMGMGWGQIDAVCDVGGLLEEGVCCRCG